MPETTKRRTGTAKPSAMMTHVSARSDAMRSGNPSSAVAMAAAWISVPVIVLSTGTWCVSSSTVAVGPTMAIRPRKAARGKSPLSTST
jgi:hypothetical protein